MPEIAEKLQQVTALLGDLARVDRGAISDADLVAMLASEEAAGRFLDTSRVLTAGEVAERSRYERGSDGLSMRYSQRKPVDFVEQVTRTSKTEAARRIRVGEAIRARESFLGETLPPIRPIVAEAMRAGELGVDAASNIIGHLGRAASGSEASPDNVDAAETALVALATVHEADDVAAVARAWRDALDPDGIAPRHDEILARRGVFISPEKNGIKTYKVNAGPVLAAELDAVFLDPMSKGAIPRFISEEDLARATTALEDDNGTMVLSLVDPRTLPQKRADILEGVLAEGLRATQDGPANLRTIGSVTAVIQLKDLQAGTGFGILEGTDEVIPASVVQQLVCENGFFPLVVGNMGEPLYHGLKKRHFTKAQRRAIIARDGDRCIAKGCRKRAAESHAHHVLYFSNGGRTDVINGVMLCPAHHGAHHAGAFQIKMFDGKPWIRDSVDIFDEDAWRPAGKNRLIFDLPK
ncbi:MAG TPA: DUF222 domain-containing protein [Galbitalea sp.]|jgi:hypothetical protein|nr:DUF222 domain-containing protein [Galbitalea sp.]